MQGHKRVVNVTGESGVSMTHKYVGMSGLWGLSMYVIVFILYKLYFLPPYTNSNLSLTQNFLHFYFFNKKKNIYVFKFFEVWEQHRKWPPKPPSHCNTVVIPRGVVSGWKKGDRVHSAHRS